MIRVRVLSAKGSTPRDAGAAMFVTDRDVTGSVGGGRMEHMAIERARAMLASGEDTARIEVPLGPEIGQCCGGHVVLAFDRAQPAPRVLPQALIFGAGHVGRALAPALAVLPLEVTLIDSRPDELARASGLRTVLTPVPEALLRQAQPGDIAVILTHDHALDFLLAAEALARGDLAYTGMIGSATKRARFERFARERGIDPAPLICPIGAGQADDKRPEFIAAFTMAEIARHLSPTLQDEPPCDT